MIIIIVIQLYAVSCLDIDGGNKVDHQVPSDMNLTAGNVVQAKILVEYATRRASISSSRGDNTLVEYTAI
jgi:hypothetical protein